EGLSGGLVQPGHLVDVRPADERLLAGPPQDHDPAVLLAREPAELIGQLFDGRTAEDVHRLRVHELNGGHSVRLTATDKSLGGDSHALIQSGEHPYARSAACARPGDR